MSTLVFVSRTDETAIYSTTAILSHTQRLRMSDALAKHYKGQFAGWFVVSDPVGRTRMITVGLTPEAT